jgi:nudix-type nucleoside diphosphatase (YffH/AdpP family)
MSDDERHTVSISRIETVSEGHFPLRRVTFDQVRRNGAHQELRREVYCIGEGAAVLPVDHHRGTVLLVRQIRISARLNGDTPLLIEACAGNVEDGEEPVETARKEAREEMGCVVHNLREIFSLYVSPGATTERAHLFLAEYDAQMRTSQGGGVPEEGEEIEPLELPLDRAWAMVQSGEIADAKTVLLLQHLRLDE